jgi:hypothetical protein
LVAKANLLDVGCMGTSGPHMPTAPFAENVDVLGLLTLALDFKFAHLITFLSGHQIYQIICPVQSSQ